MLSFADKFPKRTTTDQLKNENSMFKFVEDFSREVTNINFPLVGKTMSNMNDSKIEESSDGIHGLPLKKSSLSLNNFSRKRPSSFVREETPMIDKTMKGKTNGNGKITLLPVIGGNKFIPKVQPSTSRVKNEVAPSTSSSGKNDTTQADPYKNLTLITGNVEFAMKMHQVYRDLNLLYEIYAKILRISKGKFPCEHVILLRNETGPVMQAVFYEIDTKVDAILVGMDVRCVGKFKGSSRIQLFNIKVLDGPPNEESVIRLQNLCKFSLNKIKGNIK